MFDLPKGSIPKPDKPKVPKPKAPPKKKAKVTISHQKSQSVTITQYIEKLQNYIKPLLEKHPQYRNYYNALTKAEKNAKWQYQLIEKTILFLKELRIL